MTDSAARARITPDGGSRKLIAAVLIVAAIFSFTRLGSASLWDDEAYVALTARNLLKFHKYTTWDGRNLYVGLASGYALRVNVPPFDTLLAAGSFGLLGESDTTARLPFALFDFAALLLFLRVCRQRFVDRPLLVAYAVVLFGLSTQFLLLARNCRYYSVALFFTLVTYGAYRSVVKKGSAWNVLGLAMSAIFLFYAHALTAGAFLAALAAIHCVFEAKRLGWRGHRPLMAAALLFVGGAIPIAIGEQLASFRYGTRNGSRAEQIGRLIWYNLRDLNVMTALPWVAFVALVVFIAVPRRSNDDRRWFAAEWLGLVLCYAIALALLTPQVTGTGGAADVRYLFPALPFAAGAIACVLSWMHERSKYVAGLVAAVLVASNVLCWTPFGRAAPYTDRLRWLLPGLASEIISPYPTAVESVCEVLRQNARQDDVVVALPEYYASPLIYYVGDKVRLGGLISRPSPVAAELPAGVDPSIFTEDVWPNWVFLFGGSPEARAFVERLQQPRLRNGVVTSERLQLVTRLPLYPIQTQRPEFPWHEFGPRDADESHGAVVYVLRAAH